jgi:hypothetical protein
VAQLSTLGGRERVSNKNNKPKKENNMNLDDKDPKLAPRSLSELAPTLAVIISRTGQTTHSLPTFQGSNGETVIPVWDDFLKFQSWLDGGGKKLVDEQGISQMLAMAYDRERLITELRGRAPVDIHFCPPVGHLTGPPEQCFRVSAC